MALIQVCRFKVAVVHGLKLSPIKDSTPRVRLFASSYSGTTRMYTIARSPSTNEWTVDPDVKKLDGSEHPLPRGTFVIGNKSGEIMAATKANFADALSASAAWRKSIDRESQAKSGAHCFWISAGTKGVRCVANVDGTRVGKTDWGRGRNVECVEVLSRSGQFSVSFT